MASKSKHTQLRDPLSDGEREAELLARETKYDQIETILIQYPRWQVIIDEISFIHRHAHRAAEPRGLPLLGMKGAGKSTLLLYYAGLFPPVVNGDIIQREVVIATVPASVTPGELASALLKGMGDPRYDKGTLTNKTLRLEDYLYHCGTRLIILDEIQHFQDRGSSHVLETGAAWLKNLIKVPRLKLAVIFAGLPKGTDALLKANEGQLARFFGPPRILTPLVWNDSAGLEGNEFRIFLDELDQLLPLGSKSNLAKFEIAWRCFVASEGLMNWVMKLVRRAAYLAVDLGREHIDLGLLQEAFSLELAGERNIPNPFVDGRPELPADFAGIIAPAVPQDGKARSSDIHQHERAPLPNRPKAERTTKDGAERVQLKKVLDP